MGDPRCVRETTSFKLPPGCRFYPSEEQLLCCYLAGKNRDAIYEDARDDSNGYDLIKELDLYDYEPYELPDSACFSYGCKGRKRHWFYYTIRVLKGSSGRMNRRTKGGYWRRRGRVRDVMGPEQKLPVGTRTRFVFYLGNSLKSAVRTDWVMYEYALLDHIKAAFVLCRVLVKSHAGTSRSENIFSSCAEESVSAVRHIGIQHDGFVIPGIAEAEVYHGTSIDQSNDVQKLERYPGRLVTELHNQVATGPGPVGSIRFSAGITPNKLGETLETDGDIFAARSADEVLAILKGEFIELDDLVP